MFQSDLPLAIAPFNSQFSSSLNSDDKLDPELALKTSRPHGGILALWSNHLDPFISIINVTSSRFIVLVLDIPEHPITIHIGIYLPTAGLETEYVQELSKLENTFDELNEKFPNATIFVRGDANSSLAIRPGNKRDILFKYFCDRLHLKHSDIGHPTYHHFVGSTSSAIDVILQKDSSPLIIKQETVQEVLCSKSNAMIDSKHDLIISTFSLPSIGSLPDVNDDLDDPPEVPNTKHRVLWSDSGIEDYRHLISPTLSNLQTNWSNPTTSVSYSVLLQATNSALTSAAKHTNDFIDLSKVSKTRNYSAPLDVTIASKEKCTAHKNWCKVSEDPHATITQKTAAKEVFTSARSRHRRLWRLHQFSHASASFQKLDTILTSDPSSAHKVLRKHKTSASGRSPHARSLPRLWISTLVNSPLKTGLPLKQTLSSWAPT